MSSRGLILAIETSCDETAAAVVQSGAHALSSVVASQVATHARYGGVVPELASREHLRAIVPVVRAALTQANITLADLDAIAVTSGPGLAGALLVGITYAKALAFATGLPLIPVNHLEGHIHAVLLNEREQHHAMKGHSFSRAIQGQTSDGPFAPEGDSHFDAQSPALALVVSGGHTHLYLAEPHANTWDYTLIGRTLDDAAGEAFDKVAKLLGLGYPGGPWIDALAQFGNPHAIPFSFSQIKTKIHLAGKAPRTKAAKTAPIANLDPRFLFSFSGIKTAVLRYVELHNLRPEAEARAARLFAPISSHPGSQNKTVILSDPERSEAGVEGSAVVFEPGAPGLALETLESTNPTPPTTHAEALTLCPQPTLDLIASFQHAVIGDLMKKTFAAAESLGVHRILVTGGVAANRELRARFTGEATRRNVSVSFPTLALSTDNAAMIAAAAWPRFLAQDFAAPDLSANPSLALGQLTFNAAEPQSVPPQSR
jgi:N6-L-threonylcarbamoyladenine synthase